MAEVGLLPFARIALQVSRTVLPRYRSCFSKHQFTQPQLLSCASPKLCPPVISTGYGVALHK